MAQIVAVPATGSLAAFTTSVSSKTSLKASSVSVSAWSSQTKRHLVVRAAVEDGMATRSVTGVVFEPFAEVQSHVVQVPSVYSESLARQRFSTSCEAAINNQINVEYNVSYVYHALFSYFDRDNVALPGFAKFFKESSEEEREHAEKLMKYQNKRGGKVCLNTIMSPVMDFDHAEKGDALHSMELALALEKLVNEKLLLLHQVAVDNNDPEMTNFVEGEFLVEQDQNCYEGLVELIVLCQCLHGKNAAQNINVSREVEAIKKISGFVSQLRRIGKGHGVYHFDLQLQEA